MDSIIFVILFTKFNSMRKKLLFHRSEKTNLTLQQYPKMSSLTYKFLPCSKLRTPSQMTNHAIHLLPNLEPINVYLYRYQYFQKQKIENQVEFMMQKWNNSSKHESLFIPHSFGQEEGRVIVVLSQMHILHIKKNTFHTLSIEAHTQTINSSLVLFFFSLNNLTHSFFLTFLLLSFLLDMGENK